MPKSIETKKREAKLRREQAAKKHQMKIALTEKSISEYEAENEKAQKILANDIYDLLGNITLGLFILVLVAVCVMFFVGVDASTIVVVMIVAFVILSLSVAIQSAPIFAEKKLRENMTKLQKMRKALLELKNRH